MMSRLRLEHPKVPNKHNDFLILMDKKAQLGEQMMFFLFIFLMVVIGGGIVLGLFMFIGPEINYQGIEADVLSARIATCMESGALTGIELIGKDNLNDFVMQRCNLNSQVISDYNQIKICVNLAKSSDCINEQNPVFSTGGDFIACGLTGGSKFLGCSIKEATWAAKTYSIIATSKQKIRSVS